MSHRKKCFFRFCMQKQISHSDPFIEGGTISNIYALMLARHRKFPKIKEEGMYGGQKMVVYTSAQVRIYNTD